jgi:hypothetical protein
LDRIDSALRGLDDTNAPPVKKRAQITPQDTMAGPRRLYPSHGGSYENLPARFTRMRIYHPMDVDKRSYIANIPANDHLNGGTRYALAHWIVAGKSDVQRSLVLATTKAEVMVGDVLRILEFSLISTCQIWRFGNWSARWISELPGQ